MNVNDNNIKVLLVEDNPGDACLMQEYLEEASGFCLEMVHDLSSAISRLRLGSIDVVLLDLHLPGSDGLDSFNSINLAAPSVPIVILSGLNDAALAKEAIAKGAQDYLVKGRIIGDLVTRSINYSIERKKREEAYTKIVVSLREAHDQLKEVSLTDPLTGLLNRRGFKEKVSEYFKIAARNKQHVFLFFIDIDNMKWINDNLGHNEGDSVLMEVANILKNSFRETDIITRLGGDEFSVLVTMMNAGDESFIIERLQMLVSKRNAGCHPPQQPFFLSIGGSPCNLHGPDDIEVLLGQADKMMYMQKGLRKNNG